MNDLRVIHVKGKGAASAEPDFVSSDTVKAKEYFKKIDSEDEPKEFADMSSVELSQFIEKEIQENFREKCGHEPHT